MRSRWFQFGLLAVITASVAAMVWIYVDHRTTLPRPLAVPDRIDGDADMRLGKIRQTSTRDGIKEWDLVAGAARYMDDQKRIVFDDVAITFFLKGGQEVTLKAEKGDLQTESRDLVVSGNVVISNPLYRLETDALSYRHASGIVRSEVPVTVSGNGLHLTGDSLLIDLTAQQAELSGKVSGTFDVDFTL
jgi:LPS export ABC transporter protein LptC